MTNINPTPECIELTKRVKMGKCLYCLAKVTKIDMGKGEKKKEVIEVFHTEARVVAGENDIEKWTETDDEKKETGIKKKIGKKPKKFKEDFQTEVYDKFAEQVEKHLDKEGGWAFINVEFIDKNGNWNDKPVMMSYVNDDEILPKHGFLIGATTMAFQNTLDGGWKLHQLNSSADLEDYEQTVAHITKD